ncbi:MAG: hypothetical protein E7534_03210 [Ruminococcaceae bacterium]|nr:hypothetical protein [Oscillospiraceae bacterium]
MAKGTKYHGKRTLAAVLTVMLAVFLLCVGGCADVPDEPVETPPLVLAQKGVEQAFRLVFGGVSEEITQTLWDFKDTVEADFSGADVLYSWIYAEIEPPCLLIGDTDYDASKKLKQELGKGHKFGIKVYGSDVAICASDETMLREALSYFKRKYYKPDEEVFSVPGDLDYVYEKKVGWSLSAPVYAGGTYALEIYNGGGGKNMGDDIQSRTQVITDTNRAEFDAYLQLLKKSGYTETARNEEFDNVYVQYYDRKTKALIYTYFLSALGETRVILDTAGVPESVFEYTCTDGNVTVYQYAMMYNRNGNGGQIGDPYGNNGMFYIIRLSDNRLILVDGGDPRQATVQATEELYRFMREIAGKGEDETVDVACWYLSHYHGDHCSFIVQLADRYSTEQVNIERVMYNIPDGSFAWVGEKIAAHYPDAQFIKPHTGQRIKLGNVELEVLFTHEDYADPLTGKTIVNDGNSTSTVLRLHANGKTMMIAGDWGGGDTVAPAEYAPGIARMLAMHTTADGSSLKSDILQVAHHALNPYMEQFNAAVAPDYAFVPAADTALDQQSHPNVINVNVNQLLAAGCDPDRIYFSSRYTYALHIAQNGNITVAAEPIRGADSKDDPLTAMVEQDYVNETLKAYKPYRVPTAEEFDNWKRIQFGQDLAVSEAFRYRFSDPENKNVPFRLQGGCFDGKHFYLAFISHSVPEELAYIVVLDKDGKEVKRSGALKTGHSNSLSWRDDGTILVSVGNSAEYHIVDKKTLTVIETKSIAPHNCLSIDYCPETGTYAMLDAGWGTKLYHVDSSLTVGACYEMEVEESSAGQNFFCTKELLYSVRYKALGGQFYNYIYVHDWTGKLVDLYSLPIPGSFEAQSISVDGKTVYVPCGNLNAECILYTATLS